MNEVRVIAAIVQKDLQIEARSKEVVAAVAGFALLMLLVFNFAFDMTSASGRDVIPAALWVAFLLAGLLGFGRGFVAEREQGALDSLLLAPVDRSTLYLAKLAVNAILIGSVEIVLVPVFAVLFDVSALNANVGLTLLLGTLGYAALGTLYSSVLSNIRAREIALPLLILPVTVPIVIAVVGAMGEAMAIDAPSGRSWWGLLVAFDVIYVSASALLFGVLVKES